MQLSAEYTDSIECQLHSGELMAKTSAISVRVPDDVKAAAEKAAAADSRSVASLVEKILTEYLRSNGFLKGGKK
jgi:predicted HicB family RNase H-like nuclease